VLHRLPSLFYPSDWLSHCVSSSFFCPHPLSTFPNFFPSRFLLLLLVRPSGKLVQIEHALAAVGSGQTSLGIKDFSMLHRPRCQYDLGYWVQKIQCLIPNIGVVYSRKQAEQYHRLYKWCKAFWCVSTGCWIR
ncbi:hypothetical protein E1A91_A01G040100v1, partial [Gossypium mustelinum]